MKPLRLLIQLLLILVLSSVLHDGASTWFSQKFSSNIESRSRLNRIIGCKQSMYLVINGGFGSSNRMKSYGSYLILKNCSNSLLDPYFLISTRKMPAGKFSDMDVNRVDPIFSSEELYSTYYRWLSQYRLQNIGIDTPPQTIVIPKSDRKTLRCETCCSSEEIRFAHTILETDPLNSENSRSEISPACSVPNLMTLTVPNRVQIQYAPDKCLYQEKSIDTSSEIVFSDDFSNWTNGIPNAWILHNQANSSPFGASTCILGPWEQSGDVGAALSISCIWSDYGKHDNKQQPPRVGIQLRDSISLRGNSEYTIYFEYATTESEQPKVSFMVSELPNSAFQYDLPLVQTDGDWKTSRISFYVTEDKLEIDPVFRVFGAGGLRLRRFSIEKMSTPSIDSPKHDKTQWLVCSLPG